MPAVVPQDMCRSFSNRVQENCRKRVALHQLLKKVKRNCLIISNKIPNKLGRVMYPMLPLQQIPLQFKSRIDLSKKNYYPHHSNYIILALFVFDFVRNIYSMQLTFISFILRDCGWVDERSFKTKAVTPVTLVTVADFIRLHRKWKL